MFRKHQKQRSVKKDLVFITMQIISNRNSWRNKATGVYIYNKPVLNIMFYKRHNKNEKERFWQLVKNSAQRRIEAHKLKKRVQSKYSFIHLFCIYKLLKIYHLIPFI